MKLEKSKCKLENVPLDLLDYCQVLTSLPSSSSTMQVWRRPMIGISLPPISLNAYVNDVHVLTSKEDTLAQEVSNSIRFWIKLTSRQASLPPIAPKPSHIFQAKNCQMKNWYLFSALNGIQKEMKSRLNSCQKKKENTARSSQNAPCCPSWLESLTQSEFWVHSPSLEKSFCRKPGWRKFRGTNHWKASWSRKQDYSSRKFPGFMNFDFQDAFSHT